MQAWEELYYEKLEAREEGLAEGRAEGLAEGRAEIINNMLKMEMPLDTIAKCVGLSVDEVLKIQEQLN